jgi:hypothetical protein
MNEENHTVPRLFIQFGLFIVSAIPVFGLMVICSAWNTAVFSDPYPSQVFWTRVGDVLLFPTWILPTPTPGLIQVVVVLLFWSAVLRRTIHLIFRATAAACRGVAQHIRPNVKDPQAH